MKWLLIGVFVISSCQAWAASKDSAESFRKKYNQYGNDMQPALRTTQCRTITNKKSPGRSILECQLVAGNSLLTIDAVNGKVESAWLMIDMDALPHPLDMQRAGGLLLVTAKNAAFGDHLGRAQSVLIEAKKNKGKDACIDDPASSSRLCANTADGRIYDLIMYPSGK